MNIKPRAIRKEGADMLFIAGDLVTLKDGTYGYVKKSRHPASATFAVVPLRNGNGTAVKPEQAVDRIVTERDVVGKYGNVKRDGMPA